MGKGAFLDTNHGLKDLRSDIWVELYGQNAHPRIRGLGFDRVISHWKKVPDTKSLRLDVHALWCRRDCEEQRGGAKRGRKKGGGRWLKRGKHENDCLS